MPREPGQPGDSTPRSHPRRPSVRILPLSRSRNRAAFSDRSHHRSQARRIGDETNLALACLYCNSAKGPSIAGIDSLNGDIVRLFHPRHDLWSEHFAWRQAWLSGRTPEARATIAVLRINDSAAVAVRESLLEEGIGLD